MELVNRMVEPVRLPKIRKVRQRFEDIRLENPAEYLLSELDRVLTADLRGKRIALTCGSRGIDCYALLVKTSVDWLKSRGACPVLIPSMGSHGGATAEGQAAILAHYGITEESMGAPVLSSMETVELGRTSAGLPVYFDRNAYECDGVLLLNRIKAHTSFRGPYESGLYKMMAIGLAKQKGAEMTHYLRFENMAQNIQEVARRVLAEVNIIGGIGSIENGYDRLAELHVLTPEQITEEEPRLLERAKSLMSHIPLDRIDTLIVREIGKNISGTGMDTNVIGRYHSPAASGGPVSKDLGILRLTEQAGGNAIGMGLADFITRQLYERIDLEATYMNCLTSIATGSGKIPVTMDNDRLLFKACAKHSGRLDPEDISLVIIKNTKELDELWMSEAAWRNVVNPALCAPVGEYFEIPFDSDGNLILEG